jgi:hypothetical protein
VADRSPACRLLAATSGAALISSTASVPAACPIGRSIPGTYGHSRTERYTGSPAYRQADPLRKPTF